MTDEHSRRDELIAAAVSDDLDDRERAELRTLAAEDPTIDDEIASLRETVGRLGTTRWIEPEPSEMLRQRVVRIGRRSPARWMSAAAAAVGVVVGVGAVLGVQSASGGGVEGPPGTLGAFEQIDFTETLSGVDIDGGLVAHTWGTETVLEMQGVPVDETFEVFLVERSGVDAPSGTFRGSAVTIDCRMNAAVLRPDVVSVEIRRATGDVVATAPVPTVI